MAGESKKAPRSRILPSALLVSGAILIAAVWWYYTRQRDALKSSTAAELAAIADVKAKQIANWRSERIGDGGVLSSALVLGRARSVLLNGAAAAADQVALQGILERFIAGFHYAGAAVVDRNGESRLQVNSVRNDRQQYLAVEAIAKSDVFLSDLYLDRASRQPWMLLVIPVPDAGAIILHIDPSAFLYPYLRSWPVASRTGETLLVRREASRLVYLSGGMGAEATSLWQRGPWSLGSPDTDLANAVFRWTDYRNMPVMGVIQKIPESNWQLVAKLDEAEANAPVEILGWRMALLIVLIAALNAAVASLIWRSRQLQVYRDREAWFRQITNDTPAYLWMTAPGAATFINQRCARFFGVDQDELDSLWEDYLHPDDKERARAHYAGCVQAQSEYRDELRLRRFDGEYRAMVVHGLPRYGPGGKFAGYAGALIDITERRDAERRLRDANHALALDLEERTRSQREIQALSARLINAQEDERARLARELHDDLSQQIAAISIATSNLRKRIPVEFGEVLQQCGLIQQKLVNLVDGMRRLSHELHPAVLEHSGLAVALRNYCFELSKLTSHRVGFHVDGPCDSVPPAVALCAYRVAQEALQNSVKHAQVNQAEVLLSCRDDVLCLVVSDRGVGMRRGAAGLGLVSIRERTRLVNGTVDVKGEPGQGVTLTLQIPIPPPEQPKAAGAGVGGQEVAG